MDTLLNNRRQSGEAVRERSVHRARQGKSRMHQQTATIESPSPRTHHPIRLRVSSERVKEVNQEAAVVSLGIVDPSRENMASVQAIWSTFALAPEPDVRSRCRSVGFAAISFTRTGSSTELL